MRPLFLLAGLLFASCAQQNSCPQTDGLIAINDTELYIKAFGQGDPLLIIHGGPGLSHDYFLPHLEELANTHFVIFYDHRGTGRSSVIQDSLSMNLETFVKDIEAIRMHFQFDKMNVLAHSWGSLLAVEYALSYGDGLDKLILSNPPALSQEYDNEVFERQSLKLTEEYRTKSRSITNSVDFLSRELHAYEDLFMLNFSLSFKDTTYLKELRLNLQPTFFEGNRLLHFFSGLNSYGARR